VKPLAVSKYARRRRVGFTLIELLVVILIIGIVSAATLAVAIPAYQHRGMTQAALILQSSLAAARDAAIRANAPRGIRLMPDAILSGPTSANPELALAASRIIPIELAADYAEGLVSATVAPFTLPSAGVQGIVGTPPTVVGAIPSQDPRLQIQQERFQDEPIPPTTPQSGTIPNPPTGWFWNIRQGEKFRFADAGRYYIIAGPMTTLNTERFVNLDIPGTSFVSLPPGVTLPPNTISGPEGLFLVNGQDDDGDGFVDNSFDGIDNDGDGLTDPGFDGIDNDNNGFVDDQNEVFWTNRGGGQFDFRLYATRLTNIPPGYNPEFEPEGAPNLPGLTYSNLGAFVNKPYTIQRRPVGTRGARETVLPQGTVIDLTTFNAAVRERSRLPVDLVSGYVDILISPNGTVYRADAASGNAPTMPFYHFWIAEREDVFNLPKPAIVGVPYFLPMPAKTPGYPHAGDTTGRVLKGDRRLVTLFTKTGQIITNTIEQFDGYDSTDTRFRGGVSLPFFDAQQGVRDAP
jgi:prepilin-type N-terminal cleavage/methylation domain-containing protein